jgi:ubiquinone/menaquinone biosynthesis C-methylase UbiE
MEVNKKSPYLPKNERNDFVSSLKTSVAYRVWKSKLEQYARLNADSHFKLLDVGCGPGYCLRCFERWFPKGEFVGLDLDADLVEHAQKYLQKTKLIRHDGHDLPFDDKYFDVLCSLQVIEHLENPATFFIDAHRVLKSNGFLIIATPNPTGISAKMLGEKWQGYRYDHISLKTPQQWQAVIQENGFHILEDGTTGLTGFRLLRILPFALINWIPMALFGYFPWYMGESYMAIARKGKS